MRGSLHGDGESWTRGESPSPEFDLRSNSTSPRKRGKVKKTGYFATKPASVISDLLAASSSSRNCTMSLPVRKIGFNACFSM